MFFRGWKAEDAVDDVRYSMFQIRQIHAFAPLMDFTTARAQKEGRHPKLRGGFEGNIVDSSRQGQIAEELSLGGGIRTREIAGIADPRKVRDDGETQLVILFHDLSDLLCQLAAQIQTPSQEEDNIPCLQSIS